MTKMRIKIAHLHHNNESQLKVNKNGKVVGVKKGRKKILNRLYGLPQIMC